MRLVKATGFVTTRDWCDGLQVGGVWGAESSPGARKNWGLVINAIPLDHLRPQLSNIANNKD